MPLRPPTPSVRTLEILTIRQGGTASGSPADAVSYNVGVVAVLLMIFICGGKGVDTARRRLCRPQIISFV